MTSSADRLAPNTRFLAIEYFIKSLSSGERSAAERLEPFLAADVQYDTNSQPGVPPIGREVYKGKDVVLNRVSGQWPATPRYQQIGWSDPIPDGDNLRVITSSAITASFSFNDDDEIQRVDVDGGYGSGMSAPPLVGGAVEEIPLVVKGLINNARLHQTPLLVTHVDEEGVPHPSFRGSVCVFTPTQLSIWVRNPTGGLASAIAKNPHIALVYADLGSTGVIHVSGLARISSDEETRRKAYELTIEAEQNHDTEREGVAVVIDVKEMIASLGATWTTFVLRRP